MLSENIVGADVEFGLLRFIGFGGVWLNEGLADAGGDGEIFDVIVFVGF